MIFAVFSLVVWVLVGGSLFLEAVVLEKLLRDRSTLPVIPEWRPWVELSLGFVVANTLVLFGIITRWMQQEVYRGTSWMRRTR